MLNTDIRVDLHIHSKASEYKEEPGLVENSTIDNVHVLLNTLDDENHQIAMFSITDHNRFDSELYIKIRNLLKTGTYHHVKSVLAGVEFDVKLEEDKKPCHILALFDAKEDEELVHIETMINANLLKHRNGYYSRSSFEKLLCDIGLETILIVSQRKDLNNTSGSHRSLSDTTDNPFDYLKFGYFNAMEYQRPNVEGILRSNLMDLQLDTALVLGSDCHQWSHYPHHSENGHRREHYYSTIRCLPTFKGLLLALTSPETRFKRRRNRNQNYVQHLEIGGKSYPIAPGINAIIGENGSGKSLLINLLTTTKLPSYYNTIVKSNEMMFDKTLVDRTLVVRQGQIIDNKNNKTLLGTEQNSLYLDIDHSVFESAYREYARCLLNAVKQRIDYQETFDQLPNYIHQFDSQRSGKTFFVQITVPMAFESVENPHKIRKGKLEAILRDIDYELELDYYNASDIRGLNAAKRILSSLKNKVQTRDEIVQFESGVKNAILAKQLEYEDRIDRLKTENESKEEVYRAERQVVIDGVVSTFKSRLKVVDLSTISTPGVLEGKQENPKKGFVFTNVAKYHNEDLLQDFLNQMFNKEYQSIDALSQISTRQSLASAITGAAGDPKKIEDKWSTNLDKFIGQYQKEDQFIYSNEEGKKIGDTLGEMSLVFYKYQTYQNDSWDVLVIDQPEDNISNPKIKSSLIRYFDNLRDKKQIVFVTHNPLLVVNQDVDNVIFIQKQNNSIQVTTGCLEDEENKILDLIADNMDGGVDTIEKRLKYYGKNT